MELMDFQEEELAISSSSIENTRFDTVIGHIEDIIMEDQFTEIQNDFLLNHYEEFEDTEENKFSYTDIHREYVGLIESYLDNELQKRLPGFEMAAFSKQLTDRQDELDGEIFELLLTFSDFLSFKEMMLDFRAAKEGRSVDLSAGITVTGLPLLVTPGHPEGPNAGFPGLTAVGISSRTTPQASGDFDLQPGGTVHVTDLTTLVQPSTSNPDTDTESNPDTDTESLDADLSAPGEVNPETTTVGQTDPHPSTSGLSGLGEHKIADGALCTGEGLELMSGNERKTSS